jgi:hypothetical protein
MFGLFWTLRGESRMEALICEKCGSNEIIKQSDGMFFCTFCGTKYTAEAAKKLELKLTGTVNTKPTDFDIRGGVLLNYNGELTDVIIPEGVRRIDWKAFHKCIVTSFTFPEGMDSYELPGTFFIYSDLKSLTYSPNTTIIDEYKNVSYSIDALMRYREVSKENTDIMFRHWAQFFSKSGQLPTRFNDDKFVPYAINGVTFSELKAFWLSMGYKESSCYIATAVYGSYDAPEVLVLRRFRDEKLLASAFGRLFVKVYYTLSPPLAERLHRFRRINCMVKRALDWFVKKLED